MNDIDKKTLDQISHLAKLDIPEDDRPGLLKDLDKILNYAHMLDTIDTKGLHPCYHVLEGLPCPLREDVIDSKFKPEDLLSNAPEQTGGMVKIPPLMEE